MPIILQVTPQPLWAKSKQAVFLKDGELAILQDGEFRITNQEGHDAEPVAQPLDQTLEEVELGDFGSYMEKKFMSNQQH